MGNFAYSSLLVGARQKCCNTLLNPCNNSYQLMQSDNCHFMPNYTRIGNLLGPIREVSYSEVLKFDDFDASLRKSMI